VPTCVGWVRRWPVASGDDFDRWSVSIGVRWQYVTLRLEVAELHFDGDDDFDPHAPTDAGWGDASDSGDGGGDGGGD
jgi:hypothetical protein